MRSPRRPDPISPLCPVFHRLDHDGTSLPFIARVSIQTINGLNEDERKAKRCRVECSKELGERKKGRDRGSVRKMWKFKLNEVVN